MQGVRVGLTGTELVSAIKDSHLGMTPKGGYTAMKSFLLAQVP